MAISANEEKRSGFTLTEMLIAVSIVGTLSAIAIPNYLNQTCRSKSSEAIASIGSLKTIISAYIDETGVYPSNWDDLNSISAIMSDKGEMNGPFTKKLKLPSKYHEITISGPIDSVYKITGEPLGGCEKRSIKACLNASTGASKLLKGDGNENATDVVCT